METGKPVLVTTQHRGVFFGYLESIKKNRLTITSARCCLHWPVGQKGFLGLATQGPIDGSRVGPAPERLTLFDVTAIADVSAEAAKRWEDAPWS